MLGSQRERFAQVALPILECLAGQARDQIEVDIFKSCFAQVLKSLANIIRSVGAAKLAQLSIIKCLRAKTRAVDAQMVKSLKPARIQLAWVDLDRCLGPGCELKMRVDSFEYL